MRINFCRNAGSSPKLTTTRENIKEERVTTLHERRTVAKLPTCHPPALRSVVAMKQIAWLVVKIASARRNSMDLILKELWFSVLISLMTAWRTSTKDCLCFFLTKSNHRARTASRQCLLKVFEVIYLPAMSEAVGWSGQALKRSKCLGIKSLGKEIHWGIGFFNALIYTTELKSAHIWTVLDTCSGRTKKT